MQNRSKPSYRAAVISPLFILVFYAVAIASEVTLNPYQQVSLPSADKEIALSVKMSDDRVILVSQYEGEMIRIGQREGEMLGITPRVLDRGIVKLDFFRIVKILKDKEVIGESITNSGSFELNTNLPQSPHLKQISTIQLLSVSKIVKINSYGECPCCVVCGGQETCGLSVQSSCGSCRCN